VFDDKAKAEPAVPSVDVKRCTPKSTDWHWRTILYPVGREAIHAHALGNDLIVVGQGNQQKSADWLDPENRAVSVDKGNLRFSGRSAPPAKIRGCLAQNLVGLTKFAVLPRSRAFILSDTSLGRPARLPLSISNFFTYSLSGCAEQPILVAAEDTVGHRDGCSTSCSATTRTAPTRTSGANLFVVLLVVAPTSHELEAPANPVRFMVRAQSRIIKPQRSKMRLLRRPVLRDQRNPHF